MENPARTVWKYAEEILHDLASYRESKTSMRWQGKSPGFPDRVLLLIRKGQWYNWTRLIPAIKPERDYSCATARDSHTVPY